MALRFFADHCVSNQIMAVLQEAGHEVIRLKDVLPTESPDGLVAAKAQQLDAILLSLNGDFAGTQPTSKMLFSRRSSPRVWTNKDRKRRLSNRFRRRSTLEVTNCNWPGAK